MLRQTRTLRFLKKKLWGLGRLLFVLGLLFLGVGYVLLHRPADHFSGVPKMIQVSDNGLDFSFPHVTELTVGDFLRTYHLELREKETVFPSLDTKLSPGMLLFIARTHEVIIQADGKKQTYQVLAPTVGAALVEAGIVLDEDDIVKPERDAVASTGSAITVTRVLISEQTVEKPVVFEKKVNEDATLSWRKTIVTQKGENGVDRLVYRVSTYDGKEVNRKLIRTERTKDPVPQIVTQGTYVKLGKSHTGGASWYAYTGTLAAANPWLPKGSYVKVTNLDNDKSVIVVINDRGPFVPGRIIDLDKVAFQKIASLGAGVINVKMEEIIN